MRDGLADYPSVADRDLGRTYVRGRQAHKLVWQAYLAGWRRSRDGASGLLPG